MITEAVILAGGLGTRLRSTIPDLPKCMAPVQGRPFLAYLVDYYLRQGITKFIFSLGYMHEAVEDFLQKKFEEELIKPRADFVISLEEEPLGTGGAVQKASAMADSVNLLILNGDTFFAVDVAELSSFHEQHAAHCTLILKPMTDSDRYGVVEIDDTGRIQSFREKNWYAKGLINGGAYALDAVRFLKEGLPEKFSFENEYLGRLYPERRMYGNVQDRYFIDIGIPQDYQRAQNELPKNT